jgi:hypothetical protein
VIHVVTRGNHRQGENMKTTIEDENGSDQAPAMAEKTKATKNAHVGLKRADVAPKKGKSAKKAIPAKKASKGATKAAGARDGSKTAKVLELLKQLGGVTAKKLVKVTGWQPHSVRGFLSGTIGNKMGLTVTSAKGEDGERTYSIPS